MTEGLPTKNARLRHAVEQAAKKDPVLMAAAYEIALKQPVTASPDEVQANLQERALAIIDLRPSLKDDFKGLLPGDLTASGRMLVPRHRGFDSLRPF